MEPAAEQGCGPMRLFGLQLSWVGWFLILLVIYMAIVSPSTLGEVFGLIDRVFLAVMGGITQFLHHAIKGS
jgi:hypothetical protein